jgi:hypothetical protein
MVAGPARLAALEVSRAGVLWGGVEAIGSRPEDALVPDAAKGFGFVPVADGRERGGLRRTRGGVTVCPPSHPQALNPPVHPSLTR